MNADSKEKRMYIRNAVVCFVCTAVCIGIDIRNFCIAGRLYFNWNLAISIVLYILLIIAGIRAVKKARQKSARF